MPVKMFASLAMLAVFVASACSSTSNDQHSPAAGGAGHTAPVARGGASGPATDGAPSTDAASTGSCAKDIAAQICATVAITGAAPAAGQATAVAPEPPDADPSTTCAELATISDGGDRDLGDHLTDIGGHPVQWDASFAHYNGPGSYGTSDTQFYVSVDNTAYNAADGATVSVVVKPDFSTTLTFAGLQSSTGNGSIAGSITWTCVDPA